MSDIPLNRLTIPNFNTLIFQVEGTQESFISISLNQAVKEYSDQEAVPASTEFGIKIDVSLTNEVSRGPQSVAEAGLDSQSVGVSLPRDFNEARNNLARIQPKAPRKIGYQLDELRRIAQNLNLPSGGNKAVVSNTIIQAIQEYFGGKSGI